VIVDIEADGQEDWTEQEPGEVRWFDFKPSAAERRRLRRWAAMTDLQLGGLFSQVIR
jgi:hypothetical protein